MVTEGMCWSVGVTAKTAVRMKLNPLLIYTILNQGDFKEEKYQEVKQLMSFLLHGIRRYRQRQAFKSFL